MLVDAARALADLVEISPQIRAAAVLSANGGTIGSFGVPDSRVEILARAVRELLESAASFRSDDTRVTQIHAALADDAVFAVTGADGRTIVAVTSERPAPGLVFYDLKRCLGSLGEEGE